ncbi:MAG: hypothetical protein D6772_16005 [Bacteroidetes bacterium]|nr:MAG: hypothetical protein D6772_16005 [Bacteroidota bacterium]
MGFTPQLFAQSDALASTAAAGKFDLIEVKADGTAIFELSLPGLTKKEGYEVHEPYYKRLFIYGDGNFRMDTSSASLSVVTHRYGPPNDGLGQYYARTYANGVYSDEEDKPPKLEAPPVVPPAGISPAPATTVVDSGKYLKITRNVEVLPGDPFVNIVSVRNLDVEVALNAKLFLFYNGLIRELPVLQKAKSNQEGLSFAKLGPTNSQFSVQNIFSYRPRISDGFSTFFDGVAAFDQVVTMSINNLPPGEELHFFVEMIGDKDMMSQFDSKAKAQMDFLAVLATTDNQQFYNFPKAISATAEAELQAQGISDRLLALDTIDADRAYAFSAIQNNGGIVIEDGIQLNFLANRIIDAYTSTATLVSVHDPNFLLLESCACPAQAERYQILATIQCENEGQAPTDDVYIDLKLPPGLSPEAIIPTPISYHPAQMDPAKVRFEQLAPDSIRWFFEDLALQGTPIYGTGDPRTYAQIQFRMYSDQPPAELPAMQACIRFGFNNDMLDPVCTEAVKVDLLTADEVEATALSCQVGSCLDDPLADDSVWPWWLWLILILLVLLLVLLWLRRRR